ncbi:MAG: amidohydrolase family protein [Bacteroidota bacterium]|nr:amidohydrolase family protein [Bacteroidota bacterium]MDP4217012.1 amidohydrolase family protein [Bacteroidota bacterium]MDP4245817.1 amidohydrolase family protein [Bacteroidota bacterium]MDP4252476.1 amidohydrolase family protein [Bacteroidota bacterium]MDP4256660.1 amidohydrolase family protein [Bacteroidota bacterium]
MRSMLLMACALSLALTGLSQRAYSPSVKQFIDYDSPVIALTHARLVDVKRLRIIPDQIVIIRNGLIESVGDDGKIPVPAGAQVVDLAGRSLLPGLVLLHEHMYYPALSISPFYVHYKQLPVTFPKLYLACGATTVRTAGSVEPYSDLALKRDISLGKIAGPDMDVTAPYLEGKGSFAPQMHELGGPAEAQRFVDFWADAGCTSFKAYNFLDRATLKAAIDAAHARGLKITGHLCSVTYREAAEMGIDQLEHGFFASTDFISGKKEDQCISAPDPLANADPDGQAVKELIAYLVEHKVILTSTLAVLMNLTTLDTIPRPEVLAAMSPDTREMYTKYYNRQRHALYNKTLEKDMKMEKMFVDAGGLLTVGTDPTGNGGTLAGYGSQQAIELLVREGFTPLQAIRMATYNGALALRMEARIGSIEPGKQADLVVVDGDISQDIQNIRKVMWVFKQGTGFSARKLFENVQGQVGKF